MSELPSLHMASTPNGQTTPATEPASDPGKGSGIVEGTN